MVQETRPFPGEREADNTFGKAQGRALDVYNTMLEFYGQLRAARLQQKKPNDII